MFHGLSEGKTYFTLDLFWTEYTDFDNNIGSFDADKFIWKSKDIKDGTVICGIKNIQFLAPWFLVF